MSAQGEKNVKTIQENADDGDQLIPGAYLYFAERFRTWLASPQDTGLIARLETMYMVLRDEMHMVVIESRSRRRAGNLRNFECLAQLQKLPTKKLYEQFWATFDTGKSYWREKVSQGRLYRPRLDLYLHNYLTLMLAEEVNAQKLFTAFRDHVESGGADPAKQMALFRHYGDVYRGMDELPITTREGMFIYRVDQLDAMTFYPVLLEVFKRYRNPDYRQEFDQILTDLESYLVRRTVCGR